MKIYPAVEGHGEVKAVPTPLRRLLAERGRFDVEIGKPCHRNQAEFFNEDSVKKVTRTLMANKGCGTILFLFDGGDHCPAELGSKVCSWASAAAGQTPCAAVVAYREFETWFLASLESLRGKCGIRDDATTPDQPGEPLGRERGIVGVHASEPQIQRHAPPGEPLRCFRPAPGRGAQPLFPQTGQGD